MRVLVLGGTGSIGTAVVRELQSRSHAILALSRSAKADQTLERLGAIPVRGDLMRPDDWMQNIATCDAVIQVAATFDEDMAAIDRNVVQGLIETANSDNHTLRVIYTGGCWLYGETSDEVATEERAFDPPPLFGWMVDHGEQLLAAKSISCAIVHPGMVYHEQGGAFERFIKSASAGEPIEIWGSPQTRWPIIHSTDLACAYCDLLERPHLTGHFNVSAQEGVRVGDIVTNICHRFSVSSRPVSVSIEEIIAKHGEWARGPTLDQQMSSAKLRAATGWQSKVKDYRSVKFTHN